MKAPAFQFYADDFIGGTITMSHEERGLYILALCLQWGKGSISEDDLQGLGHSMSPASLMRVRAKFEAGDDGLLRNRRMESEREKQRAYREQQSNKGKASAAARLNRGSTAVEPSEQPEVNSPSPSPSPIPSPTPNNPEEPPVALPRQGGKEKTKHEKNAEIVLEILNEQAGKAFRPVPAHLKLIAARLAEPGIEPEGVEEMIEYKVREWKGTDMEKYLTPQTLFRPGNFAKYYDERQPTPTQSPFDSRNRLMQ